jgi:hypothetical protein
MRASAPMNLASPLQLPTPIVTASTAEEPTFPATLAPFGSEGFLSPCLYLPCKGRFGEFLLQSPDTALRGLPDNVLSDRLRHVVFHKLLNHQVIHPRADIGIGKVTAQLTGQLVISRPAYPRHHGIAPLGGKGDEVALEGLVVMQPLTAHGDIVLDGLAVPLARDLKLAMVVSPALSKLAMDRMPPRLRWADAVLVGLLVAEVILDRLFITCATLPSKYL